MLGKRGFDQHIGHQASVGQVVSSDRRQGAALQPVLDGCSLIGVPISCNHGIHHRHLQMAEVWELHLQHAAKR